MKIYATLPTMPSRLSVLETAIKSIARQVDMVFVCLNGFSEVPDFMAQFENVTAVIPGRDLGSTGRFLIHTYGFLKPDDIVLYCDDDLVYPADYLAVLFGAWRKHGGIVTVHGRKLIKGKPIEAWARQYWDAVYPCLESQFHDDTVDVCGTGAMLYQPRDLRPFPEDFGALNYDDVEFSIMARTHKLKITCIAHREGWVQYLQPSGPTIWQMTLKMHHRPLVDLVNKAELWR